MTNASGNGYHSRQRQTRAITAPEAHRDQMGDCTVISMDKKYRTRDGREVRLLCVDGHPEWPVCGLIEGDNMPSAWDLDGAFSTDGAHSDDLIEYHEPDTRTIWVNVYEGAVTAHESERKAVDYGNRHGDPIAIAQPVTFEVKRNG